MRNKLAVLAMGMLFAFAVTVSAQAADSADLTSGIDNLPPHVQLTIYKSSLDLNKDAELDLSTIGLANASLQEAIMKRLDQYADKGGPIPVYTFPTDKIDEVATLLEQHEAANERLEIINERMKAAHDLITTLKHKISELEKK